MGLDMYLYARKYESRMEGRNNEVETDNFYPEELKKVGKDILKHNFMSKQTSYQIGYWRKFNALQGYFTKMVEHDNELLHGIYVNEDEIKELIKIMTKVKKALKECPTKTITVCNGWSYGEKTYIDITVYDCELAEELLPPTAGFFYGSDYVDEYYVECLDYSLKIFRKALKLAQEHNYEIIYEASW